MAHFTADDYLPKEQKSLTTQTSQAVDMVALKARADELGITYAPNIGAEKLAERIAEKEKELADGSGDADE